MFFIKDDIFKIRWTYFKRASLLQCIIKYIQNIKHRCTTLSISHKDTQYKTHSRWSGNSSRRQLIKAATHWIYIGMATHRMPFRGGNSSKKNTHKSAHITHFRWVAIPVAIHRMPLRMATHGMPFRGSFHQIYHIWSSHLDKSSFGEWVFCTCTIHWKLKKALLASYPDLT